MTDEWPIGITVRYYREGWRFGIFEGIRKTEAKIRLIAAYKAHPRFIYVPLQDVERAD